MNLDRGPHTTFLSLSHTTYEQYLVTAVCGGRALKWRASIQHRYRASIGWNIAYAYGVGSRSTIDAPQKHNVSQTPS
jgi:hypothetical protein